MQDQVNATPAPEQADKVLRSPCRLETGKFSTHSLSTTISRLRMNGRFPTPDVPLESFDPE